MSAVFAQYAQDYDELYRDKNYEAECEFVLRLVREHAARPAGTVLDLGCGTGGHCLPLAARGLRVVGVDLSADMLARARTKAQQAGLPVDFRQSDLQSIRLGRRFDLVLAMFAVLGYQTGNQQLAAALETVRDHLEPDGLFIFDVWFGPGVLADPPAQRMKDVAQGESRIVRFARPELNLMSQLVRVDYDVFEIQAGQLRREVRESHEVRFFFPQELRLLLLQAGLDAVLMCPFMQPDQEPAERDWNLTVVARHCPPR